MTIFTRRAVAIAAIWATLTLFGSGGPTVDGIAGLIGWVAGSVVGSLFVGVFLDRLYRKAASVVRHRG